MESGLEKLHLVHARLLFIIAEIYKDGRITDDQRLQLKQFVFQDDPALIEIYESNSENLENLINGLENMVKF